MRVNHSRLCPNSMKFFCWEPHRHDFVKLNCDRDLSLATNIASVGGLIRNDWGHFIVGFAANVGHCTIVKAELWAILHVTQLAINRGFKKFEIEIDSQLVVQFISKGVSQHHPCCSSAKY